MLSGLRILLAEDNPTNQLVASQMLESLGATVAVARDGAEGLEMVKAQPQAQPFDVLLIDIEMPRMNGIELIRHLRAGNDALADLPMIALTAYVMREHIAAIDAAGADGVIGKPIMSITQFGNDVLKHIRHREATGASRAAATGSNGAPDGVAARAAPPSTARAASGAAMIDRSTYAALAQAVGPAAMSDLLGKVDSDLRAAAGRLERAVAGADIEETRAVSHILISVAGAIGAVKAQEMARVLNRAAHGGDTAAIKRDASELLAETLRVVDFVQARSAEVQP